jgi:mannose-6-phosphate isomerase-like protein (cupin superfamily)
VSFVVLPGQAPVITYAGGPLEVLAGLEGRIAGFAAAEMTVPGGFPGPPPHVHEDFDEGFYVLEGTLVVAGDAEPVEARPGSMFLAPRGERHAFSNPSTEAARILGVWGPAAPAMRLMEAIGAVLSSDGPSDPDKVRAVYEANRSHLAP